MPWWGWIIFTVCMLIVLSVVFGLPGFLTTETTFIFDKMNNYRDKRNKIDDFINSIREYEVSRNKQTLYVLIENAKIFQRLLGRFGIIKNFVKFGSNENANKFKVILDSIEEIKEIVNERGNSQIISKYCSLMIERLVHVESVYNDLIDQMEELENNDVKAYVYYLERIVILPFTVLSYIFTRPFTIANGDFNIYDKLDLNKGWQVARFILSICAELATVISLIITFIK